ncbi:MAG: PQQ-binding-like beta-propeller repeat protein [Phycisphaeraceae bacterium]
MKESTKHCMASFRFRRALLALASLVISLLVAATSPGAESEWPQFRGPGGQGVSAATGLPVAWSATKNVVWKVQVPGRGWSSPVLSNGKLYLTTALGEAKDGNVSLRAMCLDPASGKTLFDTEVFRPEKSSASSMHQKNSLASGTPIVTSDRLYVHFGHMGTAALDLSGKVLWRQSDLKYPPVHGTGGSPVLVDGLLVFSCDGAANPFVVALDAKTGAVRWKTPRQTQAKKKFSFSTPLAIQVGSATQIVSPGSGFVGGYDLKTGRLLWQVNYGEGYSVVPRPVFAHGLLFISSGFDAPEVIAIRPQKAAGDVTDSHVAWRLRKGAPHSASMVVLGDEIYFVSDGGIATCADARSGDVHWSQRLGGNFSASPVAAEGRVYFQNEAGVGFVVKASKTFELLASNDIGEKSLASIAATDGALYIRGESHLFKIAE